MPFRLDVLKTIQAIGVLFRSDLCKEMDYLRPLKLLYIADRESLGETGQPITGDQVVAMKFGPVLSGIYDLMLSKRDPSQTPAWTNYLRKDHYQIELLEDPGVDQLSPYEIRKLQEVSKRYKDHSGYDLVEVSHQFPEWQGNNPEKFGTNVQPIPLKDVVAAVGRGADIESILSDAQAAAVFDQLLGK